MNEELNNVTQAQWASCVRHAEKLQEDDFLEPFIINLQDTDSDEETDKSDGGSVCDDNIDEDETLLAVPLE